MKIARSWIVSAGVLACTTPIPVRSADGGAGPRDDAAAGSGEGEAEAEAEAESEAESEAEAEAEGEGEAEAEGACDARACGGDPVGSWTIRDYCADTSGFDAMCPGGREDARLDGTLDIRRDGTYHAEFMAFVSLDIPPRCFRVSSCAEMESLLNRNPSNNPHPAMFTCADGGAICDCTARQQISQDGGWSTSGTTIHIAPDDGSRARDDDYCVAGDTLTLHSSGDGSSSLITLGR